MHLINLLYDENCYVCYLKLTNEAIFRQRLMNIASIAVVNENRFTKQRTLKIAFTASEYDI